MAPRDPILGLTEQFNADPNPAKVNLGVGVYFDDQGKLPVLPACRPPRSSCWSRPRPRATCRSTASPPTTRPCRAWCSAPTARPCTSGRVATVQTLGGTGGLKVGADFLKQLQPGATRADQRPELGEPPRAVQPGRLRGRHLPLLRRRHARHPLRRHAGGAAGGRAGHHRGAACLLPQPHRLRPDCRRSGTQVVAACVKARGLVPFLDMAYQGFGDGIAEDGAAVQCFLARGHGLLRRHLVLEELLALRRTRRRAQRGVRQRQGRGGARAVAAEDRRSAPTTPTRRPSAPRSWPRC